MTHRAISIRQLWAFLVAMGIKDIENRSWRLPKKYIGETVLIHAAKALFQPFRRDGFTLAQELVAERVGVKQAGLLPYKHQSAKTGGIIGAVRFNSCVNDSSSPWAIQGQYHWHIEKAWPLPFHPCKGTLGFFQTDYPHDVQMGNA